MSLAFRKSEMLLGIHRLIGASFNTTLSAISIFRRIHSGHTAKVNSAEAIVYDKTIVSAFSATSAEFTWPYTLQSKICLYHQTNYLLPVNS